jgi:hypothetical protein
MVSIYLIKRSGKGSLVIMNSDLKSRVAFPVPCHACGYETPKTVAWLIENRELICPICRSAIDLRDKELRAAINQLASVCDQLIIIFQQLR